MDGTNQLANVMCQGALAPTAGGSSGNQANSTQMAVPHPDAVTSVNNVQGIIPPMSNANNAGNNLNALGMGGIPGMNNMAGMLGNPNMNVASVAGMATGGLNPNDINSVMNAVLANNSLPQQQLPQANAGMQGMMNPLVLQTMMNQGGKAANPAAAASALGINGMGGGMNNLLAQQNMMMNPAAAMGMMGATGMGNLNAMGNAIGGIGMDGSTHTNAPAVTAPVGISKNGSPAVPTNNNKAPAAGNDINGNDILLAQLMQNPMATQMIAQGLNPMTLLGGMGGLPSMGQNQFGSIAGVAAPGAANPLGALALGMNGLGSFPPGLGNIGVDMTASSASGGGNIVAMMPNSSMGEGAVSPHPNALFAFNNPLALAQAAQITNNMGPKMEGGVMKQTPNSNTETSARPPKKQAKKMKVKGKPKRPLSAYNFFFREERSRILDSLPKGDARRKKRKKKGESKKDEEQKEDDEKEAAEKEKSENESNKPQDNAKDDNSKKGKNGDKGSKDYDQVGNDGKKIPHGKIGFEKLAKLIGKRWQELDADAVEKYKKLADQDMTRYKKEMEIFLTKEAQVGLDGDLNTSVLNKSNQADSGSSPGFHSAMHPRKRKKSSNDEPEETDLNGQNWSKETLIKKEGGDGRM